MPPQESGAQQGSPDAARALPPDAVAGDAKRPDAPSTPTPPPALTKQLLAVPGDGPAPPPPAAPPKEPVMDFDDLLPYVGEFGLYQKLLFLMMAPFAFFVAFVYFAQIFITLLPSGHWCRVPQLEGLNLTREQRLELAIPKLENGKFDSCHMYAIDDYGALLQEGPQAAAAARREAARSAVVPCRYGWEFDLDEVPYLSIAAEYEWVCEDNVLPTVAQALFFCGSMAGGLVFGWMADRYGRVPALVGTNMIGFVAGLATYFVTNFWQFCVCRFVLGLAFDNCFTMMYILVLEYVGLKWRTFVANMSIAIYFTIATCMLPWIAYWIADWRLLCIATSAPLGMVLLAPFVVPESARWLVSQGRVDEAITIMKKFEKVNGKKVDPAVYEEFKDCVKKLQMEDEVQDKTYSVLDLFRTPRLRRFTLLMIIIWGCISISFDGHVRNVTALGLDVFLTFTVACAAELPADTLLTLTLDRWGRRWLAFGTLAASGIFSILAGVVPLGIPSASLAIVGRFSINITYNIGLQYAAELLPTVVRAQGVALVHIIGYAATIVAPFVVYLGYYSPVLPFVILGVIGVFGASLCLFLPETLNEELPLTLQDGESFGMGQKFCEFPCLKKPEAQHVESTLSMPNSGFARMSMRGSIRGEMYRSRKIQIHRNSVIRRSVRSNNAAPAAPVPTVQIESESSVKT